eukprot:11165903-Lingulodinium_polyedra.AAC.1
MPVPSNSDNKTMGVGRPGARRGQSRAAATVRSTSACAAQGRRARWPPWGVHAPMAVQFST